MHNIVKVYHFIDEFKENELDAISLKKISIIYRNYNKKISINEIAKLKKYCKRRNFKLFLANNFKLAWKMNLDGAYIPSYNKSFLHKILPNKKKFLIIGSSHNLKEIHLKKIQGCKEIFLSPIFEVAKKKYYLGLNKFRILKKLSKTNIIALGGINEDNLKKIKLSNASGFASITYIKKKAAQKTGPL